MYDIWNFIMKFTYHIWFALNRFVMFRKIYTQDISGKNALSILITPKYVKLALWHANACKCIYVCVWTESKNYK